MSVPTEVQVAGPNTRTELADGPTWISSAVPTQLNGPKGLSLGPVP